LDFTFVNGLLVPDVFRIELFLAQDNFEHGDHPGELEVVKAFLEWLILVDDCDVADLVQLVESFDAVLDKLS
jgi:hypothetical protein